MTVGDTVTQYMSHPSMLFPLLLLMLLWMMLLLLMLFFAADATADATAAAAAAAANAASATGNIWSCPHAALGLCSLPIMSCCSRTDVNLFNSHNAMLLLQLQAMVTIGDEIKFWCMGGICSCGSQSWSATITAYAPKSDGGLNMLHGFSAGHGVSLGSYEYLVYEKVFVAVAAEFGLQPVTDYASENDADFQAQYHEHRQLGDLLEQVGSALHFYSIAGCCLLLLLLQAVSVVLHDACQHM